jgi:hypothetical protein
MSIIQLSDNAANALIDVLSDEYKDVTFRKNNILNWIPKRDRVGSSIKQPIKTASTTAHGANDAAVIAASGSVTRKAFEPPFLPSFASSTVPIHEINVSADDETAIVSILADNIDDCRKRVAMDAERSLAGDGYGTMGIIKSNTGTTPNYVLTLTSIADAGRINVGDTMVSSVANNSSTLDAGSFVVAAIDKDLGTVNATAAGGWTPTNTHYFFNTNDKISGSYASAIVPFGFDAYLPLVNRTTTLAGVDRSTDPQSLSGVFVSASGKSIRSAVNNGLGRVMNNADAGIDTLFCGSSTYMRLETELGDAKRYVDTVDFEVNAKKMQFEGPWGPITVMSSYAIKEDRLYLLTRDTWILWNAMKGDMVGFASRAGKDGLIDSYNSAGVNVRQMSDFNVTCSFPGANVVCQLT